MGEVDVTEIVEFDPSLVSGVGNPANGTKFLLLKATAGPDCPTCKDTGKIMEGNRDCPDCDGPAAKSESAEADEIEDEVTGSAVKDLSDKERKAMPTSNFAFVDAKGGKHLPIHDEGHTRAAIGRFNQQDFSGAKGDPAKAKAKAATKIKAAAGKHGIDLDEKSNVAQAAKSTGVPDESVAEPKENGHLATGTSGLAGAMTDGEAETISHVPNNQTASSESGVISHLEGGESAYVIPAEARQDLTKGLAVATLHAAIDQIAAQRELMKDGKYLQVTPPTDAATATPGSMPWESYDSATLAQVAMCLSGCCNAIDAIQQREQIEALNGNPGDQCDAWDLQDAEQALHFAMGIAARLAFSEAASAAQGGDSATKSVQEMSVVEKVYRRMTVGDKSALQAAHDHLSSVLDTVTASTAGSNSDEGDTIQMELTKSELDAQISAAVQTALQEDRKARKAAKAEKLAKNANNGGDITAPAANGKIDEELNGVPNGDNVNSEYVNKEQEAVMKGVADSLEEVTKQVGALGEIVAKFARQPRSGGPVLDGVNRLGMSDEGRLGEGQVTKSESELKIERLTKELETATDPASKDQIAMELSRERLYADNVRRFGDKR